MKRDLAEVITKAIDYKLAQLHVSMPGTVQAYYPVTQTVDVVPAVSSVLPLDDGLLTETLPALLNVPVEFARAGGCIVALPIDIGDTGMLEFTDFSIDLWRSSGLAGPPADVRNHGIGNAVFRPGLSSALRPVTAPAVAAGSAMVIGLENGTQIAVDKLTGLVTVGGAAAVQDFVALAAKVATELGKLYTALTTATYVNSAGTPTPLVMVSPYVAAPVGSTVLKGAQ